MVCSQAAIIGAQGCVVHSGLSSVEEVELVEVEPLLSGPVDWVDVLGIDWVAEDVVDDAGVFGLREKYRAETEIIKMTITATATWVFETPSRIVSVRICYRAMNIMHFRSQ
jgi:hypothetical protein